MNLSDFCKGYVRFDGEGGFPARLLTEAAAAGLHIRDAVLQGETLQAVCPAAEYARLRPLARRACVRIRIRRKYGLYFHLFPYRKRWGLPVGVVLSALLLYILSGRIWVLQVQSDTPVDTAAIIRAVEKQGVYVGCKIKNVDMQLLRLQVLSDLENMVFVSVNPSGCVAYITVNPRHPAPSITDFHSDFSNLIAARDGVVISTEIHSGQAAVHAGDGVTAGTLLVSGTVESAAGNLYLRRASGRILAQTTRTLTVCIPLTERRWQPTDAVICRPYLRFLKWDIPLFSATPLDDTYRVTTIHNLADTDTLTLPLGLLQKRFVRLEPHTVTRSETQAQAIAKAALEQQLEALQAAGVRVESELQKDMQTDAENVRLTAQYRCIENIAKEVPLSFVGPPQKIPKN